MIPLQALPAVDVAGGEAPALAPLGVEAAIVGSALYAGAFSLPEALETVAGAAA